MDSYLFGFVVGELRRCCPSHWQRVKMPYRVLHCVVCARQETMGILKIRGLLAGSREIA